MVFNNVVVASLDIHNDKQKIYTKVVMVEHLTVKCETTGFVFEILDESTCSPCLYDIDLELQNKLQVFLEMHLFASSILVASNIY